MFIKGQVLKRESFKGKTGSTNYIVKLFDGMAVHDLFVTPEQFDLFTLGKFAVCTVDVSARGGFLSVRLTGVNEVKIVDAIDAEKPIK